MILQGNNIELLRTLEENSVDSIVTDPPYGLSFMNNKWDYDVPSQAFWVEALRVLKPGGHVLSFSSARTYHRMVVNIEDAGFEIRDQIMWVYGSGFPKNHNVGKALNKKANYELQTEWDGWGTALKPSHEPIVMARKPFKGTVVDNVLEHGTGAINIDKSRVPSNEPITINTFDNGAKPWGDAIGQPFTSRESEGRFPANFIHDGSDEVVNQFPDSKTTKSKLPKGTGGIWSDTSNTPCGPTYDGEGSAARFFYCAKANKKERNQGCPIKNNHPTVKPLRLMEYLVKLITPPGGTVLDPFMGSGSTGMAAIGLGFNFIGIELDEEYCNIAKLRIEHSLLTNNKA